MGTQCLQRLLCIYVAKILCPDLNQFDSLELVINLGFDTIRNAPTRKLDSRTRKLDSRMPTIYSLRNILFKDYLRLLLWIYKNYYKLFYFLSYIRCSAFKMGVLLLKTTSTIKQWQWSNNNGGCWSFCDDHDSKCDDHDSKDRMSDPQ